MKLLRAIMLLGALAVSGTAASLEALDDSALSSVSGREGIALDFELRMNADGSGDPLANLSNCSGTGNPCVMALQFNNRPDEWLVLKDIYGILKINSLWLDGADTPGAPSVYANPARFEDINGDCLIVGCDPSGLPSMKMQFPGSATTFETDIEWHLKIGRAEVQFGPTAYLPAEDAGGSFLGVQITDMNQNAARIDVDGSVYLIGF